MSKSDALADLGARIKYAREAQRLSRQMLANAIECPVQLIYRWEAGEVIPSAKYVCLLCEALGVSADWLLSVKQRENA